MRLKLFLVMLLTAVAGAIAQTASVTGTVIDTNTGAPVAGARVSLNNQGLQAVTSPAGDFVIKNAKAGEDVMAVSASGYEETLEPVTLTPGPNDLGAIRIESDNASATGYHEDMAEMIFDENAIEDEEGATQAVGALTGTSDNVYYNATNYNFNTMRFRFRGYNSEYSKTYINGLPFNDLARGRFNYSTLGGMNRAFRNKTVTAGVGAGAYGFGDIGGSTNISTLTSDYAPGFNGSVAFTNSAYMFRGMVLYSTGISPKNGWGVTVGAIGRYANEGVVEGTFYNSAGYFLSLEKKFSDMHQLVLTTFGAPTQRATPQMSYQEAYDLADNNLYNPGWGWQNGEKRSARITETFDPTAILNWIFKPTRNTTLNTGAAIRWVNYSSSSLSWYNASDPRPDYYRYLPSYYKETPEQFDYYTDLWRHDESFRQINWDKLYQTNYLNNRDNIGRDPELHKGSSYILADRHSNQFNAIFNSVLNHRLSSTMSLQAGVTANFTRASYYQTIRDLLGGEFWRDIDTYAERDFPNDPNILQNDLNNPNRHVYKGDKFGYNYDINALQITGWLQNTINLPRWDVFYGLNISYTQFQRDGKMRNGRAPENSYGKGDMHRFDNGAVKAGATYKLDGHNYFMLNSSYETRAPLFEYAYISPRIKDTAIDGLQSERIFTADLSYVWNYRKFRGSITGFITEMMDQTERTSFYDDYYSTFMNYVLKGVRKSFKGIELGMSYKIIPSLTASVAATYARYQYRNNPTGVRSYENGAAPDTEQKVYLKNYYVGGTPQTAFNIGLDWQAPKRWFFGINGSWMGDSYVNLAPNHHEMLPDLWTQYEDLPSLEQGIRDLAGQDKLKNAFVLNISIGKLVYINRKVSMNFNLNIDNVLNNRDIMTYGYQQGRFDYKNYDASKYPNKYSYAQGIKVFLNAGIRF